MKKKILIVEDDQIVANIYRNKFSVEGFQVEVALDGQSGMEMLNSFRPDAVVLDLMLPKMTGVDFMKQIRSQADFQQLPVIVFSNTYLTNMVQEAWKAGATKCLSKANCTPKQVIEVLRTTMNTHGETNGSSSAASQTSFTRKPATQAPATPAPESEHETQFQGELLDSFKKGLPATLLALRTHLQAMVKADNETTRLKEVQELYRRIHTLTANSGIVGLTLIAQISDALEALLKELHEKPKNLNASTMRTVASAVDFLAILFQKALDPKKQETTPATVLVVDDEAISRRAVTYALEKAKLKSVSAEDPNAALAMMSKEQFDLIFLDVDMPGMNGFELCTKLRALPEYKKTPVVFVTSLNDFESRANSTMSGGNDFIAKPFLFMELAVKALLYVLRNQLESPQSRRPLM
jgi:DNA-binding response OmpR family regulator